MNPAVEWVSRPSRPSDDLPSSLAATSSGSVTTSYVDPRTNSPGCRMNGSSASGSTSRVRSGWSCAGSMCGYLWFSNTRKNRSSRTSTLDGCTIASSKGSKATRLASISLRMSRSERSTSVTLPARPAPRQESRVGTPAPSGTMLGMPTFHRYVALGDSFTEGVGDHDPTRPNGVRGWADRVAEVLGRSTDDFGYANLAIRGRKMDAILAEQVEPALALRPDLVTIYAGGNDFLRPRISVDAVVARYGEAVARLTATGATVLLFTGFDL